METIYRQFVLEGNPVSVTRYGNGHINDTYLLLTDQPHAYILQRLNTRVFANIPGLMDNLIAVTDYLRARDDDPRHVLTLVPTLAGERYLKTEACEYWRLYEFVTDSICLDKPQNANDLLQSGVAFGGFQNQLAGFPADTLVETVPRFHDTPDRYLKLHDAIRENRAGRLADVSYELAFYLQREAEAGTLMDMLRRDELPLRVTHNDTKLNNVMLDKRLRTPLCVIDLDTVMPGLAANDFGDGIRYGASTAAEDEKDISKVKLSLELFQAYAEGFLGACGARLTPAERETLPMGAKLMTLECGVRFLTDYLNGDVYFHIARPEHNLDRARTQMALVEDKEKKWGDMERIIGQAAR